MGVIRAKGRTGPPGLLALRMVPGHRSLTAQARLSQTNEGTADRHRISAQPQGQASLQQLKDRSSRWRGDPVNNARRQARHTHSSPLPAARKAWPSGKMGYWSLGRGPILLLAW